jgi:hypothetical protein
MIGKKDKKTRLPLHRAQTSEEKEKGKYVQSSAKPAAEFDPTTCLR